MKRKLKADRDCGQEMTNMRPMTMATPESEREYLPIPRYISENEYDRLHPSRQLARPAKQESFC